MNHFVWPPSTGTCFCAVLIAISTSVIVNELQYFSTQARMEGVEGRADSIW